MSKLPKTEEAGERCVRRIQEFLLNEMSSGECGVLPEDKLQRLMVGVSFTTHLHELEFASFQTPILHQLEFPLTANSFSVGS